MERRAVLLVLLVQSWVAVGTLNNGLVLYMPFNGNTQDESGNSNHGTSSGSPTLVADKYGNANSAYSFDGTDDKIDIPDAASLQLNGAFSFACWATQDRAGTASWPPAVLGHSTQSSPYPWRYVAALRVDNSNTLQFVVTSEEASSGWKAASNGGTTPSAGTWFHLAGTWNPTTKTAIFYLDGTEVNRFTQDPITRIQFDDGIKIGHYPRENSWWKGMIDEVRVYNRVLTDQEVFLLTVAPTDAPDTAAPATPAPDTPAPDTPAPDTPAPDTPAPDTPAPDTPAPDTPAPDTPAPDTPAPDTPAPDTPVPDTLAPDTPAPDTLAPATPAPDTPAPDTPAPDTPAPDTPAPATPAPDTPAPDTPAPDTPAPDTLAPPTPAPPTPAPPTSAPDTPAPPTPAPPTLAPPTPAPPTPAPPTNAPPTPAPPTPAPPTPAPPTLAPPTLAPPTPSPPTPAPPTLSPSTPAPDTMAPPTAIPTAQPTAAPSTNVPRTFAPFTAAPETDVPITDVPPSLSPDTRAPSTSAPDTRPPSTSAPRTALPPTFGPPTPMPTDETDAPSTPVPRVEGKGKTYLELGTMRVTSKDIQNNGGVMEIKLNGGTVMKWEAKYLSVLVKYPGGEVLCTASEEPMMCDGRACVVLETDTKDGDSPYGLASLVQKDLSIVTAELVKRDTSVADALNGTDVIRLVVKSTEFRAYSPNSEQLKISVAGGMFERETMGDLCKLSEADRSETMLVCDCGKATCEASVKLESQTKIPNSEEAETVRETSAAAIVAASVFMPASPTTGGAVTRMSLLLKTMYCPSDGPTKMDRTLNPLGLTIGKKQTEEVNGALVGSIALQAGFLLLCGVLVYCISLRQGRKGDRAHGMDDPTLERHGQSWIYIMARARVGWVLVPVVFLYGGAILSGTGALLYSSVGMKLAGVADLLAFGCGFLYYVFMTGRRAALHAEVHPTNPTSTLTRVFWGESEWVSKPQHGDESWVEVHKLLFDGYKKDKAWFLSLELGITMLLGIAQAWEPETAGQCQVKGIVGTILLFILLMALLLLRPYLAIYEAVMDVLVVTVELVMTVCIVIALNTDKPDEHWSGIAAGHMAMAAMYLILAKFVMDNTIFVIDEYTAWKQGGSGSFIRHLLCCGNSLSRDKITWDKFQKAIDEEKELEEGNYVDLSSSEASYQAYPQLSQSLPAKSYHIPPLPPPPSLQGGPDVSYSRIPKVASAPHIRAKSIRGSPRGAPRNICRL